MKEITKVSLIIAIYKNIEYLDLIFLSLENQSFNNFEVIIAEDDDSKDVANYISEKRKELKFDLKHLSQQDLGFRKNRVLNKAIKASEGEYLVFIDGDCILHKHFLREHLKRAKKDRVVFGRRVMLDKEITGRLVKTRDLKHLSIMDIFLSKSRKKEEAIYLPISISTRKSGIIGCNMSLFKENLIKINGFDEDFETPFYGEDTDVYRRLELIGIKSKCSKFNTIQYHLYHRSSGRDKEWEISEKLYNEKVKEGLFYCKNGIEKMK